MERRLPLDKPNEVLHLNVEFLQGQDGQFMEIIRFLHPGQADSVIRYYFDVERQLMFEDTPASRHVIISKLSNSMIKTPALIFPGLLALEKFISSPKAAASVIKDGAFDYTLEDGSRFVIQERDAKGRALKAFLYFRDKLLQSSEILTWSTDGFPSKIELKNFYSMSKDVPVRVDSMKLESVDSIKDPTIFDYKIPNEYFIIDRTGSTEKVTPPFANDKSQN